MIINQSLLAWKTTKNWLRHYHVGRAPDGKVLAVVKRRGNLWRLEWRAGGHIGLTHSPVAFGSHEAAMAWAEHIIGKMQNSLQTRLDLSEVGA